MTTVSVEGLHHAYGDGALRRPVLFDVDLTLAAGEVGFVMGPSGSGKTTLLTLVGGLRSVQQGRLCVLGRAIERASAAELVALRRQIGFVFQSHNLMGALTVLQNVALPLWNEPGVSRRDAERRARGLLERVGLADRREEIPDHLSIGQRQRVAVARALIARPRLLLADEPTASLDGPSGREVAALVHELAKENACAVLLITHDDRLRDLADRVWRLSDGRIGAA